MSGQIVLLGATGYTGRLIAEALARRGAKPLLAGRDPVRLAALAGELGGLATATVDVSDAAAVRALIGQGDVLVTTVGPFQQLGEPALRAAAEAGAVYIDSTGEPGFIRRVFDEFDPLARRTGAVLLTAMGYDFLPGNLAAALALRAAGPAATAVEVGYFIDGPSRLGISRGTAQSATGILGQPGFALRDGRIQTEPSTAKLATFQVGGRQLDGVSIAGTEHLTLGGLHQGLSDVDVYVGWFGKRTRLVYRVWKGLLLVLKLPGVGAGIRALIRAGADRAKNPAPGANDRARSVVVARVTDRGGQVLSQVELNGPEPYQLTGELMAWAAIAAAQGGAIQGSGALGPVQAFGLDPLTEGCALAGLRVS